MQVAGQPHQLGHRDLVHQSAALEHGPHPPGDDRLARLGAEQADQGRTVLFATHYLEEADAIADRVLVLHRGRLLADGTAAEIKAKAGARRISFDLPDDTIDEAALRALPFLTTFDVSGRTVRLRSSDADATVHSLYGLGVYPRNLEVAGLGLEQAFVAITTAEEARTS
jgi:ABC-2 type transport system ATP-binding protein